MAISAKVVCDSVSVAGVRLTTFEIEVPRIVWAEILTHRQLSRNAASSRAIPFFKMQEQLTGIPSRFGAANKGMQDAGVEHTPKYEWDDGRAIWKQARKNAAEFSYALFEAGYHKQVYNRLTEPFQTIKAVITATEWDNFFWLRDDSATDPTLRELAVQMKLAMDVSVPQVLTNNQWHLPYVDVETNVGTFGDEQRYKDGGGDEYITLQEAIIMSCARCAAVSYRNENYTLEKCKVLYDRLVGSDKLHSSALEHVAKPMRNQPTWYAPVSREPADWDDGVSHIDKNGSLWSGNFKGFIQYRKTIKGECYEQN
jgi:thymidylate synthase ThyX